MRLSKTNAGDSFTFEQAGGRWSLEQSVATNSWVSCIGTAMTEGRSRSAAVRLCSPPLEASRMQPCLRRRRMPIPKFLQLSPTARAGDDKFTHRRDRSGLRVHPCVDRSRELYVWSGTRTNEPTVLCSETRCETGHAGWTAVRSCAHRRCGTSLSSKVPSLP